MEKILILADQTSDGLEKTTELMQKAKSLGFAVGVLVLDALQNDSDEILGKLGENGADAQYFVKNCPPKFDPMFFSDLIQKAAEDFGTRLIGYNEHKDTEIYAANCAADLKTLCFPGIFNFYREPSGLLAERMAYAGKVVEKISIKGGHAVLGFKPKSFPLPGKIESGISNPVELKVERQSADLKVGEVLEALKEGVDLGSAEFVVGVGRGAKNEEGVAFVREFAESLNAAFGGSRAIIDAGFLPPNLQIGQTGKSIAPKFYICVGVSGAIQHIAGMNHSKVVLAVNSDPDAPIFKNAHYGIVGDLFEVLPLLRDGLKKILKIS